jgi:DNA-binding beta-propeller fold protein YncE
LSDLFTDPTTLMKHKLTLLAAALSITLPAAAAGPIAAITPLWSFNHNVEPTIGRSSEIPVWDALSGALWVVGGNGLDVLDLAGNRLQSFSTSAFGSVNSIAISGQTLAVAFTNGISPSAPGSVQFFDRSTFLAQGGNAAYLGGVNTGAVPDMVTWTAGGTRLLVANEGERRSNADNPVGSISLIDVQRNGGLATTVKTAGFTAFDGQEAALRAQGIRIQAGVAASVAFEPEYIAVAPNGKTALVTLQENNALAELDLQTAQVTRILPLGTKDFSQPGNAIDPSDRDFVSGTSGPTRTELRSVPVKGLYMPDAIVSYSAGGKSFYVMANEGDAFVDDADTVRLGSNDVTLDAGVFANAADLKKNENLGRLTILREGTVGTGNTTNMTEIVALGGRSFSIRDADGKLVYDSGNLLEAEAIKRGIYADGRSDDKGVEPEGVALYQLGGRTLAFIGLERTSRGAVAIFDITDPAHASFVDMIVADDAKLLRPEGLVAFSRDGRHFLAVAHESTEDVIVADGLSNRTALYEITPVPEPSTYALMLAGLAGVAALARRRRGRD